MAKPLDYELSFAGVPFLSDLSESAAHKLRRAGGPIESYAPRQRPVLDLIDEIDKKFPFYYIDDLRLNSPYPGKSTGALPMTGQVKNPVSQIRIGDWYYPTSVTKWSVFRGLMTSSMVKAVLVETLGYKSDVLKMQAVPDSPRSADPSLYTVQSQMYMLPPRPLAEHGGDFDGLFLVTLVDDRYFFQDSPATLKVIQGTTWEQAISTLQNALGPSIYYSTISPTYSVPEPDSQFWANAESAPFLLDAVAYNLGRVVVRNLDGTYNLLTADESSAIVSTNRGNPDLVVRLNGGDMFYAGNKLPSGNLTEWRNATIPSYIRVAFPKYVYGDDPVPHFLNTRYGPNRPTSWYEDSFGQTYNIDIPITSGGAAVDGLVGISNLVIHNTAKALYLTEASSGGDPVNVSDLTTLATKIAVDYYSWQSLDGLDESYPGTYNWAMEGFHDVVWTYSERQGGARTRVIRRLDGE